MLNVCCRGKWQRLKCPLVYLFLPPCLIVAFPNYSSERLCVLQLFQLQSIAIILEPWWWGDRVWDEGHSIILLYAAYRLAYISRLSLSQVFRQAHRFFFSLSSSSFRGCSISSLFPWNLDPSMVFFSLRWDRKIGRGWSERILFSLWEKALAKWYFPECCFCYGKDDECISQWLLFFFPSQKQEGIFLRFS